VVIEIRPACLRDLSYIMAYLRERDAEEVYCQLPEGTTGIELAYGLLQTDAYVALVNGQPVAGFGTAPLSEVARSVWALGTDKMRRAVPAITRFFQQNYVPKLISDGNRVMEARSTVDHVEAHRWMKASGAKVIGPPFTFGRGGKQFLLFRWTAEDFEGISSA
jgi:hypothetical protein